MKPRTMISSLLMLGLLSLMACNNDHEYYSNDPDAAPDALSCYDVNDLYQDYSLFFKPVHGWVGDPMPFYKDGTFHVFYLQDARDGAKTFHPWYKVNTTDLVSYTDEGEMIPCGTVEEQDGALGTGSVFEHNGLYYAFYTGHNGALDPREKILLATSADLKSWTKDESFALEASWGYDRNEFRDPIIIRDEATDTFRMLLSTRADYKGSWRAVIAQYSSTDLYNWTLEEPFYDDESTFMVECPDIFTQGGYQYLIYSDINDRMVHYKYRAAGSPDWITPANSALDGIAYYAGKTAYDGTNRYLFAWCPTRENHRDANPFGWAGSLVVHQLIQNQDGTLYTTIPQSISEKIATPAIVKITGSRDIHADGNTYKLSGTDAQDYIIFDRLAAKPTRITAKITASTSTRFGFELGACGNRREVYALTFDTEKDELQLNRVLRLAETSEMMTSVHLPKPSGNEYDVAILIENSVCVIYVNGQKAFTNRIYQMNQNPWGIFADNGEVTFSNLNIYN